MDELNANPETGAESQTTGDDPVAKFAALLGGEAPQEEASSDVEGAEEGQPEEEPAKEEPEEKRYRVKVDGQEIEVSESELLQGYQRDADYRNKTKAVAEERRQIEATKSQVVQEREHLKQAIDHFLVSTPEVQPPDPSLIEADPVEYLKQQRNFEMNIARRQQAIAARQHLEMQQQQEAAQSYAQHLQQEKELLLSVLPDWKDDTKAKAETAAIREYLKKTGYDEKAIDALSDHRSVVLARKAMLYDQMVGKADAAKKQVKNLPPPVQKPGAARDVGAQDGRTRAMQQLKRSGSTDAAAAVFERLI